MADNLTKLTKELAGQSFKNRRDFVMAKSKISNRLGGNAPMNSKLIKKYKQLIKAKKIKPNKNLEVFLKKREIRTMSGVAPVTVITKPFSCPGRCLYCPTEKAMPKSYLANEPAIMRAQGVKFDPFKQVKQRLQTLKDNGHAIDKIELIILGGTWSSYPHRYQTWFVKRCFEACNGRSVKNLYRAQQVNETAPSRIIGLSVETRPDCVTIKEIIRLRELGCTRVELGVQSIADKVLKLNERGHGVARTIMATTLLKQAGLKIVYHLMPNLPGSNPNKDLLMFSKIFSDSRFQPDMLKIYPCVVTKNSRLYRWWRQGKFHPYSDEQLKKLLIDIKTIVPPYVRINRLIRDIPSDSIIAGNKITNLRQLITQEFTGCRCLRCREAGHVKNSNESFAFTPRSGVVAKATKSQNLRLKIIKYRASAGTEYFFSYESNDGKILYAFLRLRINDDLNNNFIQELHGAGIIRELHTYGEVAPLGNIGKVQHLGLGKKLILEAEKICQNYKIKKIVVISGIGVRPYYKKLGYRLEGTYMVKSL